MSRRSAARRLWGRRRAAPREPFTEADVVFNVVWTGTVFPWLQYFVASQIAQSGARFRFVANGCPPDQVELMERFRARHPDRVVEVLDVSPDEMVAHGVALERVRDQRDDGPLFGLIDPDIKACAPFVGQLLELMESEGAAAVTSGKEVWTDDNIVPEGHIGVAGEFFYDRNGFVFGSPHLAIYRRDALDEVAHRWGARLGSAGPDLTDAASEALRSMGHEYIVYDTGKIVNALIQVDGGRLVHRDYPHLLHIGGLAHYLSPPAMRTNDDGDEEPDWVIYDRMVPRHEVARFASRCLERAIAGEDLPPVPADVDGPMAERLALVHSEVGDMVSRYTDDAVVPA